ncbi:MAG: DUF1761 domain-containing protein [Saprospiraceae bacterium]
MEFNWLAHIVAAASSLVIGAIYYHPKVLGTKWMASANLTDDDLKGGNMAIIFGGAFVLALIVSVFLKIHIDGAHLVSSGSESHMTFGHGALHGGITAFMVAMPIIVIIGMFERKKALNNLLHLGYWVITFAIMTGIVDAWR